MSDEANGGNSTDDFKYSGEEKRGGSVSSATSVNSGILKTTTIEIRTETDESQGSSTRSSLVVPKGWEDALPMSMDGTSDLLSMVVEQGRLAKARRSML